MITEGKTIINWEEFSMKKICAVMILSGIVLACVTAGGVDANCISTARLVFQAAISALLVLFGTHFAMRGETA